MTNAGWGRRFLEGALSVAAALVAFGALAEGATRFLNRGQTLYDVEMYRYSRLLKEDAPPDAGAMHHWHRQNASAVLQGVEIRTNELRMRDKTRSLTPAPGVRRILVLGDSITLGWGVPQDKTYSAVLDSRLANGFDARYEVLNAGVGNYTTARMISYYDYALRPLDAETVVIAFYLTNASREQESSFSKVFDTPLQFPVFLWSRALRVYSRFSKDQSFRDFYLNLYRDGGDEYEAFKKDLGGFISRLKMDGRKVLLVDIPDVRYASSNPYPFESVSQRVLEIGRQNGAETLDLLESVRGLPPDQAVNSAEDRHPSPAAHRRFAEAILQKLRDAGFVAETQTASK